MKLLREYIRAALLTEAAKTIDLLPDNVVVGVGEVYGGAWRVGLYYLDENGEFTGRRVKQGDKFTDKLGEPLFGSILIEEEEEDPCAGAVKVAHSKGAQGWGPFLYDIALEYAATVAPGLMPDRLSVSSDARYVWNYYMMNRGDVDKFQLDDPYNRLTPDEDDNCDQDVAMADGDAYDWEESPLSKMYIKNDSTTLDALRAAGKLVEM